MALAVAVVFLVLVAVVEQVPLVAMVATTQRLAMAATALHPRSQVHLLPMQVAAVAERLMAVAQQAATAELVAVEQAEIPTLTAQMQQPTQVVAVEAQVFNRALHIKLAMAALG